MCWMRVLSDLSVHFINSILSWLMSLLATLVRMRPRGNKTFSEPSSSLPQILNTALRIWVVMTKQRKVVWVVSIHFYINIKFSRSISNDNPILFPLAHAASPGSSAPAGLWTALHWDNTELGADFLARFLPFITLTQRSLDFGRRSVNVVETSSASVRKLVLYYLFWIVVTFHFILVSALLLTSCMNVNLSRLYWL